MSTLDKCNVIEYGPFNNLMVQDAIIIIAIYAAQVDLSYSEEYVKRIKCIAEHSLLCVSKKEGITSRINLFVNGMQVVDREKALIIAMEALTLELRKTAFEMAAKVVIKKNILSDRKAKILNELVTKLSIEAQFAVPLIKRLTNPTLSNSI